MKSSFNLFKIIILFLMSLLSLSETIAYAHLSLKDEIKSMSLPYYNWSGFYAGLNIGAVKHTLYVTDNQAVTFNATIQQSLNPKLTGGFQVGYRHQLDCVRVSALYGLEISADFSDANFKKQYGSPFALYQLDSSHELKTVALLELIGGLTVDRTLFFLAAGISWVDITGNTTNLDSIAFFNSFSFAKTAWGAALSAGVEYAFTDAISARVKVDVVIPNIYTTTDDTGNHYQITNSIMQGTIGINYRFA